MFIDWSDWFNNVMIYISWQQILLNTLISILILLIIKLIYHLKSGSFVSNIKLNGKTVLITGGSSGIGKSAALDFAARGARVLLACRNSIKTHKVISEIREATSNKNVIFYWIDTSDLKSVRECAKEILKNEDRIDILINNAGTAASNKRILTAEGLEYIMAANHYGHFLFTNLLLGKLKSCSPSRIVNVSSTGHKMCKKLDPEDLNYDKKKFGIFDAYGQSKLCNILFTLELSKKLKGTGVTTNSLHPGIVDTEILEKSQHFLLTASAIFVPFFGKTCKMGAQTIIYLALAEEVAETSGKYFVDCKETKPSILASNATMAQKLWLASELDVKLTDEEKHFN